MSELGVFFGHCCECGIAVYGPNSVHGFRTKDAGWWYCINGHKQHWSESEADKLRRERDRLKQEGARLESEWRFAEDRAAKAERALFRAKKRSAAGTCPCCQRTFGNMATHMRKQHPEFVAENVVRLKSA